MDLNSPLMQSGHSILDASTPKMISPVNGSKYIHLHPRCIDNIFHCNEHRFWARVVGSILRLGGRRDVYKSFGFFTIERGCERARVFALGLLSFMPWCDLSL